MLMLLLPPLMLLLLQLTLQLLRMMRLAWRRRLRPLMRQGSLRRQLLVVTALLVLLA
jgi:hypothetical protein